MLKYLGIIFFLLTSHHNRVTVCRFACECPIQGTHLYVDVYYVVTHNSRKYPKAHLRSSSETHERGHTYIEIVNTNEDINLWNGGPVLAEMQWRFVETELPGWYHLENRKHPDAFATWSVREDITNLRNKLVLDPNYPGEHENRMDFFIRPYLPENQNVDTYQLKIKTRPLAVIKYSTSRLRPDADLDQALIELDMSEPQLLRHHQYGGKSFEETLFKFRKLPENTTLSLSSSRCRVDKVSWTQISIAVGISLVACTRIYNFN